ncbi:putative odorant receptor 19b [Lycorma delicatula]|uniref:putative odorant receptor 19b n=1 Tax=Lycorma delicatula TaxID=130591 RepID=UPI003F514968
MGDLLTYEWNSLTELGFGTNWFACSRNIHNLLKIIFQRCQSQFKLLGLGVYPVSSETFLSIIMSAYSYIMVLNQLKTKGHL